MRPEPGRPRAATLLVNGVPSSWINLDDPAELGFEYMQQMAAVIQSIPQGEAPLRVLHLGAAGCALAAWLAATRPARQVAVDLDEILVEQVRTWFDLPRSPALRIRAGDAAAQVGTFGPASMDVVVRDVFAGAQVPPHVTSLPFVTDVARVLGPTGTYLANTGGSVPFSHARRELATIASVFPHVAVIAEPGLLRGRGTGNLVLVGSGDAGTCDATVERALRRLPAPARLIAQDDAMDFCAGAAVITEP